MVVKNKAMDYSAIIDFWFKELSPKQWWVKDNALDQLITNRFLAIHTSAKQGECFQWRESPHGRLAEIIVLDQFSRNIYRDQPESFAQDSQALTLAQEAISSGAIKSLSKQETVFTYMPFMHSESKRIHEVAVELFSDLGNEDNLNFELKHKVIIDRFGRYPHRNEILGRPSTPEEVRFLQETGSSF